MTHEEPERKRHDPFCPLYGRVLETIIGNLLASGYTDFKRIHQALSIGDAVNAVTEDLIAAGLVVQRSDRRKVWYSLVVDKDELVTALYALRTKAAKLAAAKVGG